MEQTKVWMGPEWRLSPRPLQSIIQLKGHGRDGEGQWEAAEQHSSSMSSTIQLGKMKGKAQDITFICFVQGTKIQNLIASLVGWSWQPCLSHTVLHSEPAHAHKALAGPLRP